MRLNEARELRRLAEEDPSTASLDAERYVEALEDVPDQLDADRLDVRLEAARSLCIVARHDATELTTFAEKMADILVTELRTDLAAVEEVAGYANRHQEVLNLLTESLAHTLTRMDPPKSLATESFVRRLFQLDQRDAGRGFALWCAHVIATVDPDHIAPYQDVLLAALESPVTTRVEGSLLCLEQLVHAGRTECFPQAVDPLVNIVASTEDSEPEWTEQTRQFAANVLTEAVDEDVDLSRHAQVLLDAVGHTNAEVANQIATILLNSPNCCRHETFENCDDAFESALSSSEAVRASLLMLIRRIHAASGGDFEYVPSRLGEYLSADAVQVQGPAIELFSEVVHLFDREELQPLVDPLVGSLAVDHHRLRFYALKAIREIADKRPKLLFQYMETLESYTEQIEHPRLRSILTGIVYNLMFASTDDDIHHFRQSATQAFEINGGPSTLTGFSRRTHQQTKELLTSHLDDIEDSFDVDEILANSEDAEPMEALFAASYQVHVNEEPISLRKFWPTFSSFLSDGPVEVTLSVVSIIAESLPTDPEIAADLADVLGPSQSSPWPLLPGLATLIEPLCKHHSDAATALFRHNLDQFSTWVSSDLPAVRAGIADVLGSIAAADETPTDAPVELVLRLVEDDVPYVRGIVAEVLADVATSGASALRSHVPDVVSFIDDEDVGSRYHALDALGHLWAAYPDVVDPYRDDVIDRTTDPSPRIRVQALLVLARGNEDRSSETTDLIPVVGTRLSDSSETVRGLALRVLFYIWYEHPDHLVAYCDSLWQFLKERSDDFFESVVAGVLLVEAARESPREVRSAADDELLRDLITEAEGNSSGGAHQEQSTLHGDIDLPAELTPENAAVLFPVVVDMLLLVFSESDQVDLPDDLADRVADVDVEDVDLLADVGDLIPDESAEDSTSDSVDSPADSTDDDGYISPKRFETLVETLSASPAANRVEGVSESDFVFNGDRYALDVATLVDQLRSDDPAPAAAGVGFVAVNRPSDLAPHIEPIIGALDGVDCDTKALILMSLQKLSEESAAPLLDYVDCLVDQLSVPDETVRVVTIRVLLPVARESPDRLLPHVERLGECLRTSDGECYTVQLLFNELGKSHPDVLEPHAATFVESLANPETRPTAAGVFEQVAAEFPDETATALDGQLEFLQDIHEVEPICARHVLQGLAALGPARPKAVHRQLPHLESILRSPYEVDRSVRKLTLGIFGGVAGERPELVLERLDAVEQYAVDDDPEIQILALKTLGRLAHADRVTIARSSSNTILRSLESTQDETSREIASNIFSDLVLDSDGTPSVDPILEYLPPTDRFVGLIDDLEGDPQRNVLLTLTAIGDARAAELAPHIDVVSAAIDADDPAVRRAAILASTTVLDSRKQWVIDHLDAVVDTLSDADDGTVRTACIHAITAVSTVAPDMLIDEVDALVARLPELTTTERSNLLIMVYHVVRSDADALDSTTVEILVDSFGTADPEKTTIGHLGIFRELSSRKPAHLTGHVGSLLAEIPRLPTRQQATTFRLLENVVKHDPGVLSSHYERLFEQLETLDTDVCRYALNLIAVSSFEVETSDVVVSRLPKLVEFVSADAAELRRSVISILLAISRDRPVEVVSHLDHLEEALFDPDTQTRKLATKAVRNVAAHAPSAVSAHQRSVVALLAADETSIAMDATLAVNHLLDGDVLETLDAVVSHVVRPTSNPMLKEFRVELLHSAVAAGVSLSPEQLEVVRSWTTSDTTRVAVTAIDVLAHLPQRASSRIPG